MAEDKEYVFRADRNYSGGDIVSGAPDKRTSPANLRVHVGMGSRTDKTPYISTSSNIVTMQKYMAGKDDEKNTSRAKVYLIALDKMPKDEEYTDESPYYDFSNEEALSKYFGGSLPETIKNFGNADSEVTVSRRIPEERIKEVHPILVDILALLESRGGANIKQKVLEKIEDSSMSVDKVNQFIERMIQENKLNSFELEFVKKYYGERLMLDYHSPETPSSIFARQCIRTQLLKTLAPELLSEFDVDYNKEFVNNIFARGFFDFKYNNNLRMTVAKRDNDYMMLKGFAVELKSDTHINIPYGMTYYYKKNSNKKIVDSWKSFGIRVDRTIGNTIVSEMPDMISYHDGPEYLQSAEVVEKERNNFINNPKNAKRIRSYNMLGKGICYYSFDDNNICVKLAKPKGGTTFNIEEIVVDEGLKPLVGIDLMGYKVDSLDESGTDINGLAPRSLKKSRK